ncbi:CHASE4 domain-containing protein [Legionella sp. CNM-4043-24]|uniref:CHASE4 domain-containing protein n=1 Tax=Legionella sp. CNM-4043-24 TaxID=3421646 RepID=UPI00403AEB51
MKLLMKIRLMVILTWLLIITIVVAQSYFISLNNIKEIEQKQIAAACMRLNATLQRQKDALNLFAGDWGHWNDTYKFMQKKSNQYIHDNLEIDTAYKQVSLNYILYFDQQGRFYDGRSFDFQSDKAGPVPKELLEKIYDNPALIRHNNVHDDVTGFIDGDPYPILLTSFPITNYDMSAKPNGNLVMGFNYGPRQAKELSDTVRADIEIFTQTQVSRNPSLKAVFQQLADKEYLVQAVDNQINHIFIPLKNLNYQLIGMFRVQMTRTSYMLGLYSIYKSIAVMIFSGLIIFLLFEFLIKRMVLDRLFAFQNALNNITRTQDFNQRIPVQGRDEIANLAEYSNKMLNEISVSQKQLISMLFNITDINRQLNRQIEAREAAEAELATLNSNMIIASRRAGMADVANSVLHNIGNILNSVNVSANLIQESINQSDLDNLIAIASLLEKHQDNYGAYLMYDSKGRQIPTFIILLAKKWQDSKSTLLEESSDLLKNIDLIRKVIASQQELSTVISTNEWCQVSDLVDDALFFCKSDLKAHMVTLKKEYADIPKIHIDRIKVLQILVNVIKNAIDSLAESIMKEKLLTVRILAGDSNNAIIEIIDNGQGISKENLGRIFSFGFTTKKHGHGIGLHGSCNSAQELGGFLVIHSEGVNKGATATLSLPYQVSDTTGETLGRNQTDTSVADRR